MKGKKIKIFGVMMALAMVVSMMSVGIAAADPGSLKWSEISIPQDGDEGDYTLFSGSDVGPITTSPDGGTIFAASGEDMDTLMRSADGGSTWKMVVTKIEGEEATNFDDAIVAIAVSPDYGDDDTIVVVTEANVYISTDRGKGFMMSEPAAGWSDPTSIALAADANGNLGAILVGDSDDVYLKAGLIGSWVAQEVDDSVLAVGFSTSYAADELIVAVVSGGGDTRVRAKFGTSAWGATIPDAILFDITGDEPETFDSERASIGIPGGFSATDPTLFVGVVGGGDEGDIYSIAKDGGDWIATDLNVRDSGIYEKTQTDIWSISVSGNGSAAVMLVGTEALNVDVTPRQYLTYASGDGGQTFAPADKQPTGEEMASVVLGAAGAYVGTQGDGSALSGTVTVATPYTVAALSAWEQKGLIDVVIDDIVDMVPGPTYATDGNLYVITYDEDMEESSLWKSVSFARIYSSTLTAIDGEPAACNFNVVRGAGGSGIFVAEAATATTEGTTEMRFSDDSGVTFSTRVVAKEAITTLTVVDASKLYTGDVGGNVWETINGGITWSKPTESEIDGTVIMILPGPDNAILVGNAAGTAYICYDRATAFEFERVGPAAAGTGITLVAYDVNYIENNIVYAACMTSQAVYRFAIGESTTWTKLNTDAIGVSGLALATDGTLYISDRAADEGVARSVNPTADEPDFYSMTNDLPAGATLAMLRVVPGGSNILYAVNTAGDQLLTLTDTLTGKTETTLPAGGSITGTIIENGEMARVVLSWVEMTKADEYQYQVALDENFGTKIASASDTTEGQVVAVELYLGVDYYWRVRAIEPLPSQWSDTMKFSTVLGPGGARPVLHAPEYGATDVSLGPVLQWSGLADAAGYELVVAKSCDFGQLVVDKVLGAETAYQITSNLSVSTDYCWKVRAISDNSASPWSDTSHFKTASTGTAATEGTPSWVWAVIAISAILLIAVIVLIVRTRRAT